MPHFADLVDLASERLGGAVLFANDDFFAEKENLLKPEPAVFVPDRYTDRGKWMDGWESRRRRTPGHDFCVLKLGLSGVVRGVDVDTSHFKGNFPEAFSLDAACAAEDATLDDLGTSKAPWSEIQPCTPLRGDSRNLFPVGRASGFGRVTHLRLHIYPDGGVARLRVFGDVVADWRVHEASGNLVDLCALSNGGLVLASSDSFFGSHQNLLMPGRASSMKEGWETRRSRRKGYDWAILRLGSRGVIQEAEIDTNHFKGNYPDTASIEICDAPEAELPSLTDPSRDWQPLLVETKLEAHTRHLFAKELVNKRPATHARLRIYPDGGVSRLRLYGRPAPPQALPRLNQASGEEARAELLRCCGSSRWASEVSNARPFASHLDLFTAAEAAFQTLADGDWLEAFRAHPRIGDREALRARFAATATWAEGEQAAALAASDAILDELARGNEAYEARFSHIFILCASGEPASRMLSSLRDRLKNPPDIELRIAASEQQRITRLRLGKLLA